MLLRYGMNPHQRPAHVEPVLPGRWPIRVLSGEPSYVNVLDAINAWALVRETAVACGLPAATSFKHVSPAGAALAGPIDPVMAETFGVGTPGALTSAYVRARDADPRSSYGDMVAVSEPVDAELADLLRRLPSDGIVAPGFAPGTVETLSGKKGGRYVVFEAAVDVRPPDSEMREVGGLRLIQPRDVAPLTREMVTDPDLTNGAITDLLLGLVVLRYTQSNSVVVLRDGMALGIGAGQQSRIDGTRLAVTKSDTWWLRRHPRVQDLTFDSGLRPSERTNQRLSFIEGDLDAPLSPADRLDWLMRFTGLALVSDGAIPFRDNIDLAARHGVRHVAEPGGSTRSREVERACSEHGITRLTSVLRLLHH